MKTPQTKTLYFIGGVILLLLAGWLMVKSPSKEGDINPEDILIQEVEMGNQLEETGLSLLEQEQARTEIETVLQDLEAESTILQDVLKGSSFGTAYRVYKDGKFYHKAVLKDLPYPEKGFFYEGWLVDPSGNYFSTGRVLPEETQGLLYYQSPEDKTGFTQVVITLEAEDSNPAPDKHVLEGKF